MLICHLISSMKCNFCVFCLLLLFIYLFFNKKCNFVFVHQLLCTTIFFGYESLCWHSKLPFFINYTDNVCLKIPLWIFKNRLRSHTSWSHLNGRWLQFKIVTTFKISFYPQQILVFSSLLLSSFQSILYIGTILRIIY